MFFGSWISCRRFASFSSSSSIFVLRFFSVVSRDVKERERERERERESTRARFSLLFFKLSLSLFNKAQCNKVSLSFSSAACPLKKKLHLLVSPLFLCLGYQIFFFSRGAIFLGSFLFFFSLWRSSSDFLHHAREECTPSLLLLSKNHRHTEKAFFLWRESFLFCCLSLFSNRRRASVFLNRRPKEEREREKRSICFEYI